MLLRGLHRSLSIQHPRLKKYMAGAAAEGFTLPKYLAHCGVCSRREAQAMMEEGRVTVNLDHVPFNYRISPTDAVFVDDDPIRLVQSDRVFLYFKRRGQVVSTKSEKGTKGGSFESMIQTIMNAFPNTPRLVPVGRLDVASEGLMVLSNNPTVAAAMERPGSMPRVYRVRAHGPLEESRLARLRKGAKVIVKGRKVHYRPMKIEVERLQGTNTWFTVELEEGKNREIKNALAQVAGLVVNRLIRTSYGPYTLSDLKIGTFLQKEMTYSIAVVGATGFSGRLVCDHLARMQQCGQLDSWVLVGRTENKLLALQDELQSKYPNCRVGLIPNVNAELEDTVEAAVKQAKVVVSCAGPFLRYGTPVIKACVKHGVHYCDITGEGIWVKDMIDQFHSEAVAKKLRIVPFCGFDSVPSDLGVLALVKEARKRFGSDADVDHVSGVVKMKGGISGGSLNTLFTMMESSGESEHSASNAALLEDGSPAYERFPASMATASQLNEDQGWTTVFPLGFNNVMVVRRSNSLLHRNGEGYGPSFSYIEKMGAAGWFTAVATSITVSAFMLGASFSPTRWLLKQVVPAPGNGPTEQMQREGFFNASFRGTVKRPNASDEILRLRLTGPEPYKFTGIAAAEAALALAYDQDKLPKNAFGIQTPASSLGSVFMDRLLQSGMQLKTE